MKIKIMKFIYRTLATVEVLAILFGMIMWIMSVESFAGKVIAVEVPLMIITMIFMRLFDRLDDLKERAH